MLVRIIAATALLVALALPAAARAAAPVTVGTGHKPGVAVDAAGTAYLAWYGNEASVSSLQFCRLPRGASTCAHRGQITTPGTSLSRPFVTVSGSTVRVVQYRYGMSPGRFDEVFEYVSTDGGTTFPTRRAIGVIPFDEAVQGPGDTISAATLASTGGLRFQNMPLGGGSAGEALALLSPDHPYNGTVGLIDAGTPLTAFSNGESQTQFRRYDGSGDRNDVANWTPAVDIGYADYPRLAGGPSGLFLLAGTPTGGLEVRRYNGVTFGLGVALTGNGDDAQDHITQDAAGRLHAVFPQGAADGLHLIHATSDDGAAWRSGTVLIQTAGAIGSLRAAVAPDHVGVVAWETASSGDAEIRVTGIGPEAPVDPTPPAAAPITTPPPVLVPLAKPKGRLAQKAPKAKRISRGRVRLTLDGKLARPAGVSAAQGCRGSIVATVRRGEKRIARKALAVGKSCRYHRVVILGRKQVKRARKLSVTLRFGGNPGLASASRSYKVTVRKR